VASSEAACYDPMRRGAPGVLECYAAAADSPDGSRSPTRAVDVQPERATGSSAAAGAAVAWPASEARAAAARAAADRSVSPDT